MKPKHLLDAMEHISDAYITEAKPHKGKHNESRVEQQAKSAAETVTLKQKQQKSQHSPGKEITMSSQSFGHRIVTGVIAAAACFVFVGGGIFIAQQAKQVRPDVANSGEAQIEEVSKNFLGGSGEIHVAGDMDLMYDDSRIYFSEGHMYADRNGSEISPMYYVGDSVKEFLVNVFWDGEKFLCGEGESLYILNNDGTHAETPFFSLSDYYPQEELEKWPSVYFTDIQKLTGNYYSVKAVSAYGQNADNPRVCNCLFNSETGKSELSPFDVRYGSFTAETDDSILLQNMDTGGLTRYTFSTKSRKEIKQMGYEIAGTGMFVKGDTLYTVLRDNAVTDTEGWKYGKVDLSTGMYSIIQSAPQDFARFVISGDKMFAVNKGGMYLNEADPEWENITALCYYDDVRPERFADTEQNSSPEPMVFTAAADENYVDVRLNPGLDAQREMLYDRSTGKCTFYYFPHEDASSDSSDAAVSGGSGNTAGAPDEDLSGRVLETTNAFIDFMTNKNETYWENLSVLDEYLVPGSSAYKDMHNKTSDIIWNNAYSERIDREMSVTKTDMTDENTCICDVHFDYQLKTESGNAQDYDGDIRWTFVRDENVWKASAYTFITPDDTNGTASAQQTADLTDVSGNSFHGKLLKIKDASRVYLGVSGAYSADAEGKLVMDMAAENGAVAAINAGGFEDLNGIGNGGTPLGLVISQGKLLWGELNESYDVIGFDQDNILHAGTMTGKQATELGLRDAVSYGPVLIADGKSVYEETGDGDSYDPHTAIGQTADGTVLLLVIEGRQANSLGATYSDIIDIMLKNGAVTAANLSGGSCSHMICNNEMVTVCSSLYGPRKLPNCWLVAPES